MVTTDDRDIALGLLRVTRASVKTVCFAVGHAEYDIENLGIPHALRGRQTSQPPRARARRRRHRGAGLGRLRRALDRSDSPLARSPWPASGGVPSDCAALVEAGSENTPTRSARGRSWPPISTRRRGLASASISTLRSTRPSSHCLPARGSAPGRGSSWIARSLFHRRRDGGGFALHITSDHAGPRPVLLSRRSAGRVDRDERRARRYPSSRAAGRVTLGRWGHARDGRRPARARWPSRPTEPWMAARTRSALSSSATSTSRAIPFSLHVQQRAHAGHPGVAPQKSARRRCAPPVEVLPRVTLTDAQVRGIRDHGHRPAGRRRGRRPHRLVATSALTSRLWMGGAAPGGDGARRARAHRPET